jgi:hypothetical protein
MRSPALALLALFACLLPSASGQYEDWRESGALFILTTPEGANLPATAVAEGFPLLVRLDKDFFDFTKAQPHGEDLRVASKEGAALPYQIEDWDAARGAATIWVRVPRIVGNARQELRVYWGNANAKAESSGAAVFGESNGYAGVWHLGETVADETGTLTSQTVGTALIPGMIGGARRLAGKEGIFGGDKIPNYPAGASPHSTEVWFRSARPNATILGWGNEGGGRGSKVRMLFRGPPHIHVDSDFSDVDAPGRLPMGEWIHVVHTWDGAERRIYINGEVAGTSRFPLNIKTPARLWLGGWYNNYDYVGDLDEVRISRVARSADWVRLEYENQKALQTLVGPIVQRGEAFSVTPAQAVLLEGKSATFAAQAGGAQRIYWIIKRNGTETVAAVDRFSYTLDAGRVSGDKALTLQLKAVYATETKTRDIPVTIRESIPDPVLTLQAPAVWNGRDQIEVRPIIKNLGALQTAGAAMCQTTWSVFGGAVIKEIAPDRLILKRSQFTGTICVLATVDNGGEKSTAYTTIDVKEPSSDPWVARVPEVDEKPVDNQFFARDDSGLGTLFYNGKLEQPADAVFLKLYAEDKLIHTESLPPTEGRGYGLSMKLKPGLIHYKVEFGVKNAGVETVERTVSNLVCGDAYIIAGQSNAVADVKDNPETSEWIRSFGNMSGGAGKGWANAVRGSVSGDLGRIGYWGYDVAKELVSKYQIPICIINGAVGGTRVDQHQPTPGDHADPQTIYGKLYARIVAARLSHGVRGLFWYQGENNQGANSPTGDEDWKTYQPYFIDLAAAWKSDYPNLQSYYVFQFWPNSCAMGGTHAGDMTGEMIRTLPTLFSRMRAMSVLGIVSPGSGKGNCHFAWQGYAQVASLILPAVECDNYGLVPTQAVTAPNLLRAWFTNAAKDQVALEFDQPMLWNDETGALFYLGENAAPIRGGGAAGNVVGLKLNQPAAEHTITYLKGKEWDGKQAGLLYGANKVAALTFCDVPIMFK